MANSKTCSINEHIEIIAHSTFHTIKDDTLS